MKELTKKIIDGKEVIVVSEFKEINEKMLARELDNTRANMRNISARIADLKEDLEFLKKEEEFYAKELEVLVSKEEE